jgi:hypothetical protein
MTYKAFIRVRLKRHLDSFIITSGTTSQFAPDERRIAEATTGLPCRTMVQIRRPMRPLVYGRRHVREHMVGRSTVEEVADWL